MEIRCEGKGLNEVAEMLMLKFWQSAVTCIRGYNSATQKTYMYTVQASISSIDGQIFL